MYGVNGWVYGINGWMDGTNEEMYRTIDGWIDSMDRQIEREKYKYNNSSQTNIYFLHVIVLHHFEIS